jgi:valyl-tRNA synthetase
MEKAYHFTGAGKNGHRDRQGSVLYKTGSRRQKSGGKSFSILLPPLDAAAAIHMGHAFALTLGDIILRRKSMQGLNTLACTGVWQDMARSGQDRGQAKLLELVRRLGVTADLDPDRLTYGMGRKLSGAAVRLFLELFGKGKISRGRKQWIISTGSLATPALEAVERGDITFIPDIWKDVSLGWLKKLQDKPVSRSGGKGYSVPVYVCSDCNHRMVVEEIPAACSRCGSLRVIQDPALLDTRFLESLWPLVAPALLEETGEDIRVYPFSLIYAGFDTLFSRVAPMLMTAIHATGKIPTTEVLINGRIRLRKQDQGNGDEKLGSGLLEVIDRYGPDAFRFSAAVRAVPGRDIRLSMSRLKGSRCFANKIWNTARFVMMNVQGDEDGEIAVDGLKDTDKWVLHGLNLLVEKVNDQMDRYRIDVAAGLLYHFFRHQYCGWYLEFSRLDIADIDTRRTLRYTLYTLLRLLHPFVPLISEEIYRRLWCNAEESLLQTGFPAFGSEHVFPAQYRGVEILKKVVKETRKIRSENRIHPKRKVKVYLKSDSAKEKSVLERGMKYFDHLTNSSGTDIVPDFSALSKGFKGVCLNWEVLLPFDRDEDRLDELARLRNEEEKIKKSIVCLEKKIINQGFVDKAPKHVVAHFKKNLQERIDKHDRIRKTIDDLV